MEDSAGQSECQNLYISTGLQKHEKFEELTLWFDSYFQLLCHMPTNWLSQHFSSLMLFYVSCPGLAVKSVLEFYQEQKNP